MATEIEKKFLMPESYRSDDWLTRETIEQGYIAESNGNVVRVRTVKEVVRGSLSYDGYLTIKGKRVEGKLGVPEYEFRIPYSDAVGMLKMASSSIEKVRFSQRLTSGHILQVDVFSGRHIGLVVAEIEFKTEEDARAYGLPPGSICDVTDDKRFTNVNLSKMKQSEFSELLNEVYP